MLCNFDAGAGRWHNGLTIVGDPVRTDRDIIRIDAKPVAIIAFDAAKHPPIVQA